MGSKGISRCARDFGKGFQSKGFMSRWKNFFRGSNDPLPVADLMQYEPLARQRLSQMAYDYVRSGGADEITMRENRLAFERLRLSPRVLADVSQLDTRTSLFGAELEHP